MGVLTLSEMRTEIDSTMGNRTNVTDARINTWINMAYFDVAAGITFEALDDIFAVATVAADHDYVGPTNPLVLKYVRDDTNNNLLTWKPKDEFLRKDRSAQAAPERWTRHADSILLWPTPDGVYNLSVYYTRTPAKLALDADVTILPGFVDNALILLGAHYGFLMVGEDQRAIIWLNRAIAYLSGKVSEDELKNIGGIEKSLASTGAAGGN